MNDEATQSVIALAKHVIGYMQANFVGWKEVYVRLDAPSDYQCGCRASYSIGDRVELISAIKHAEFSAEINRIGPKLRDQLPNSGKKFCVCLLRADAKFNYHIDFEWEDPSKWNITKLNGASGLPEGLEALSPLGT